ncbi:MAG: LLM class flavin-dependent oxidoreductase [Candidatus Bathyarchaeia archaeon]
MVKVGFGFCVPIFSSAGDTHARTPCYEELDYASCKEAVLKAEKLGFDSLWVADHLFLGKGGAILECWTTLSALASVTKKMRIGTIHLCNIFRHPALVAKMAATLDLISGGRLEFFIDAGWAEGETKAYGFPWEPDPAVRIQRMEEAIEIARLMWTQEKPSYRGRYYRIEEAVCEPKPLQKPHPPIWIGTFGGESGLNIVPSEELMMKAVAKYANVWNNTPASVEVCKSKLEALRKACFDVGRSYSDIGKSLETEVMIAKDKDGLRRIQERIHELNPRKRFYASEEAYRKFYIVGNPEECVERIWEYVDLGINRFMIWFLDLPSTKGMEIFSEMVMPEFR